MFPVLAAKGIIASQEAGLMVEATLLMLIVAVPVIGLLFFFAWRYRAGNKKAVYMPNWEHSKLDELIWWAIPIEVILVLGALIWSSTHLLDPYRPIDSTVAPITVQVVSLDWKWLFIYPAQGIATVNYLAIPEQTPVAFQLTSDAPMNAFWIPQLGGQEMAMPGMTTQLHLMANGVGTYIGMSSNFSGEGFAGMQFPVYSMTQTDFDAWAAHTKASTSTLTFASYKTLSEPSSYVAPAFYALGDSGLYTKILMQFMNTGGSTSTDSMDSMQMDMQ
jgi:cytochrome o ubiquinol oxidase subunit 2